MKVYKHGTRIKSLIGDIEGVITEVSLQPSSVVYKMSYFSGGSYMNVWLYEFEFEICAKKSTAGFNQSTELAVSNTVEIEINN